MKLIRQELFEQDKLVREKQEEHCKDVSPALRPIDVLHSGQHNLFVDIRFMLALRVD